MQRVPIPPSFLSSRVNQKHLAWWFMQILGKQYRNVLIREMISLLNDPVSQPSYLFTKMYLNQYREKDFTHKRRRNLFSQLEIVGHASNNYFHQKNESSNAILHFVSCLQVACCECTQISCKLRSNTQCIESDESDAMKGILSHCQMWLTNHCDWQITAYYCD